MKRKTLTKRQWVARQLRLRAFSYGVTIWHQDCPKGPRDGPSPRYHFVSGRFAQRELSDLGETITLQCHRCKGEILVSIDHFEPFPHYFEEKA